MAKWIYDRWKGYTVEDCACEYCLYFGGKHKGEIECLAEECVCKEEMKKALQRQEEKKRGKTT